MTQKKMIFFSLLLSIQTALYPAANTDSDHTKGHATTTMQPQTAIAEFATAITQLNGHRAEQLHHLESELQELRATQSQTDDTEQQMVLTMQKLESKIAYLSTALLSSMEERHNELKQNATALNWLLFNAVACHSEYMILPLISVRADVNAPFDGKIPLGLAVHYGYSHIVDILIAGGANVNAVGPGGWSALHVAVLNQNKEVAQKLINARAHVDICSDDRSTPLSLAQKGNDQDLFALVRSAHTDPSKFLIIPALSVTSASPVPSVSPIPRK